MSVKIDGMTGSQNEMHYIKVAWKHDDANEPALLYSELDETRLEVRKVEVFRNRRPGYASEADSRGGTQLGEQAVPPPAEIDSDSLFNSAEISPAEFENIWQFAAREDGFLALVSISEPSDFVTDNGIFHLARVSGWEPGGHFSEVKVTLANPIRQTGSAKDRFMVSVRQLGSPFLAGESVPANFISEFLPATVDGDALMMFVGALEIIENQ